MNAKELIEHLQKQDQEKEIRLVVIYNLLNGNQAWDIYPVSILNGRFKGEIPLTIPNVDVSKLAEATGQIIARSEPSTNLEPPNPVQTATRPAESGQ